MKSIQSLLKDWKLFHQFFVENDDEISRKNLQSLERNSYFIHLILMCYFIYALCVFHSPYTIWIYAAFICMFGSMTIISIRYQGKNINPLVVQVLCSLCALIFFALGIAINWGINPTYQPIILIIFYMAIPILFTLQFENFFIILLISDAVYVIGDYMFQRTENTGYNIFCLLLATLFALMSAWFSLKNQAAEANSRRKYVEIMKEREQQLQSNVEELEQELAQSRVKVSMNQMQPHFLYNALSAIRTITKSDPDYASDLLYDFSTHLRGTIRAMSSDDPISFTEELGNVKAYLNIERMRFGEKLQVEYDIKCQNFSVIPLSIQPIVENATRHGIYQRGKRGGKVIIRSYETDNDYVVEVTDDGVGFDVEEVMGRTTDSVGLKSLIFRLDSLMHATVEVHSEIDVGTDVKVTIPKEQEGTIKVVRDSQTESSSKGEPVKVRVS